MKYKLVMRHVVYRGYRWEIYTSPWWWPFWSYLSTFIGTVEEAERFMQTLVQHGTKTYRT